MIMMGQVTRHQRWEQLPRKRFVGQVLFGSFLMMIFVLGLSVPLFAQDRGRILFTAAVGPDKVLLRWAGTKELARFSGFNIHRRQGGSSTYTTLNALPIRPLTNPAQIQAVFNAPGEALILQDIQSILGPDYAKEILRLRSSAMTSDFMKLALLVNTNYGVSISEALGYLDRTVLTGTRYTYELWGVDGSGVEIERLGKVSIVGGSRTQLPAPAQLEWVPIVGPTGDKKIYLRWQGVPPSDSTSHAEIGFGYDIYRMEGRPVPATKVITDADIAAHPSIYYKVNSLPVIILPASNVDKGAELFAGYCTTAPGCHVTRNDADIFGKGNREFRAKEQAHGALSPDLDLESIFNYINDFFFMDDRSLSAGPELKYGQEYTYWVVARDLLRQHGLFSAPVQATVRDTIPPKVPYNVQTSVTGDVPNQKTKITWDRNVDEPNPANEPGKYRDDTQKYKVYRRFGDINANKILLNEVIQPADPNVVMVEYIDTSITKDDWGNIYWYYITAVDGAQPEPNESPYSAPAKGVVHDLVPPDAPVCTAFCEIVNHQQEWEYCRQYSSSVDSGIVTMADVSAGIYPTFYCEKAPDSDVVGIKVYRSIDGVDFYFLEDVHYPEGSNDVTVVDDDYKPRVSQQVYYKFKAFDENTNLSGLSPDHPPRVLVKGDPPPAPLIVGMKYVGKDTVEGRDLVEVNISVINTTGIAGFNLYKDENLSEPPAAISVPAKPCPESNWGTAEFLGQGGGDVINVPVIHSISVAEIPASGLDNVEFDQVQDYFVLTASISPPSTANYYAVTAYDFYGQESSKIFYHWAGQDPDAPSKLNWPSRLGVKEETLTVTPNTSGLQKICLDWEVTGEIDNDLFVHDELNYVVFRVRGGDQTPDRFTQISPLIVGPFNDPPNSREYCDNDIIFGEEYHYMVLGIGEDGEIVKSFGPASTTVNLP